MVKIQLEYILRTRDPRYEQDVKIVGDIPFLKKDPDAIFVSGANLVAYEYVPANPQLLNEIKARALHSGDALDKMVNYALGNTQEINGTVHEVSPHELPTKVVITVETNPKTTSSFWSRLLSWVYRKNNSDAVLSNEQGLSVRS